MKKIDQERALYHLKGKEIYHKSNDFLLPIEIETDTIVKLEFTEVFVEIVCEVARYQIGNRDFKRFLRGEEITYSMPYEENTLKLIKHENNKRKNRKLTCRKVVNKR